MHGFQLLCSRKVHRTPANRELGKSKWRDTRGYRQDSVALIQISIWPVLLCAWMLNIIPKNCDFIYFMASSLFSSLSGIWQKVHIHESHLCPWRLCISVKIACSAKTALAITCSLSKPFCFGVTLHQDHAAVFLSQLNFIHGCYREVDPSCSWHFALGASVMYWYLGIFE